MQLDPLDTTPLVIVYAGVPASLMPVEHLYDPSTGTAADAEGVPVVSTDAANKNGSVDLNNFEMVNIAISPSYDDRESGIAQKVFGEPSPDVNLLHQHIELISMN